MLLEHITELRELNTKLYTTIILYSLKEIDLEVSSFTLTDNHLNYIKEVMAEMKLFSIRKLRTALQEYIWNLEIEHEYNGKTGVLKVFCPHRYDKSEGELALQALEIDIVSELQQYADRVNAILSQYGKEYKPYTLTLKSKANELTIGASKE